MSETQKKPGPVADMQVTWVNPRDNPRNADYIKYELISRYGLGGLTVGLVDECKGVEEQTVTLKKYGKTIIGGVEPLRFEWRFLQPI